jgi:hypothetical protein
MTAYDYSQASEQRSFELIPEGTIAVMEVNIRPGGAGDGGIMKRTKNGDAEALDLEFIITEGPLAKRKLWGFYVTAGTTDGHKQAADITHSRLRAILQSVRAIKPTDVSEAAKKARLAEYSDFDGMRFLGKIGIEKGTGDYKDKNILLEVVTPDKKNGGRSNRSPSNRRRLIRQRRPRWRRSSNRIGRSDAQAAKASLYLDGAITDGYRRRVAAAGDCRGH